MVSHRLQLNDESASVYGFEVPAAIEPVIDLEERADDRTRELSMNEMRVIRPFPRHRRSRSAFRRLACHRNDIQRSFPATI
jgi:hypothetical protein